MIKLEIGVNNDMEAEKIISVLREAEEENILDFSFNTYKETLNN